jgi:acyl-CoA thioesterase-1
MAAPTYAETILVLGDSLSAAFGMAPERGWVHLLRTQLNPTPGQHRVINASISGETTAGGAARLGRLLERHRPSAVIIELGGNDGLRGMALRDSRVQLGFMINLALTKNTDVLLLGMRLPPNYGPTYTAQFEAMFSTLAEEYAIRHIPFFLDGVAQTLLLNKVWPSINALLQEKTQ